MAKTTQQNSVSETKTDGSLKKNPRDRTRTEESRSQNLQLHLTLGTLNIKSSMIKTNLHAEGFFQLSSYYELPHVWLSTKITGDDKKEEKMWIKRNKGDLRTRLRDNIDQRRISNNCDECVEGSRGETG